MLLARPRSWRRINGLTPAARQMQPKVRQSNQGAVKKQLRSFVVARLFVHSSGVNSAVRSCSLTAANRRRSSRSRRSGATLHAPLGRGKIPSTKRSAHWRSQWHPTLTSSRDAALVRCPDKSSGYDCGVVTRSVSEGSRGWPFHPSLTLRVTMKSTNPKLKSGQRASVTSHSFRPPPEIPFGARGSHGCPSRRHARYSCAGVPGSSSGSGNCSNRIVLS